MNQASPCKIQLRAIGIMKRWTEGKSPWYSLLSTNGEIFFFIYNNTRGVRRGNLCYTSKYLADMLRKKYRRKVRKMMYNLICHEAVGTVEADGVISGISFSILQSSVPHFKHQWNYDRFVPDQIMLIMADSPRSICLLEYKPFLAILLILGSAFVRANVKPRSPSMK